MAPLAPGRVPSERDQFLIDEYFKPAPRIPKNGVIAEEVDFRKWKADVPPVTLRQERQNPLGEEHIAFPGTLAFDEEFSESAVWKRRGEVGL